METAISQYFFIFSFLIITIGCTPEQVEDQVLSGEDHLSFSDDGAWCWFSDPRAVYYQGNHSRTYSGWVDSKGSIVVGYYDHDSMTIETAVIDPELQIDDHNNPSLFFDPEGKLMVFYSLHSSKSPMRLARAKHAENITEWEPVQKLAINDTTEFPGASNTYTYTNICQLSMENNLLYLFWRGVDFKPNYSTSSDNGLSWEPGGILILPERTYSNRRPYLKMSSNHKDVMHFAFTDGHPNKEPTNSIYYAQYKNGQLVKANGGKIKEWTELPLDPAQSDVVYDANPTGEKAWIWDVTGNAQDEPVIVYSRFPNDSTHVYYYAFRKDGQWNNIKLVNSGKWFPETPLGEIEREPNYSGGVILNHHDPSMIYLSREINGVFEIEQWKTEDQGENWKVTAITANSKFNNIRPFVARNHPQVNSPMVLWMNVRNYVHYTDFDSSIKMYIPNF